MDFSKINGVIAPKKGKLITNYTNSNSDVNHSYMEYKQYRGPGGVRTSQMVQVQGNKYCGASSSTSQFVASSGTSQFVARSSTSQVVAVRDMQVAVAKKKAPNQNSNRAKQRSKVLKNLNEGTLKDVEKLPSVGAKSAEQIITHRTFTGPYKRLKDLEDVPGWKGKRFDRFMEANQLND